jgi:hypothetical protein
MIRQRHLTWRQAPRASAWWGRLAVEWTRSGAHTTSRRFAEECARKAAECARKAARGGIRELPHVR